MVKGEGVGSSCGVGFVVKNLGEEVGGMVDAKYVYSLARKWSKVFEEDPAVEFEDLVQTVWLAVVIAGKKWQEGKGTKFTTYVWYVVRSLMVDMAKGSGCGVVRRGAEEVVVKVVYRYEDKIWWKELMERLSETAKREVLEVVEGVRKVLSEGVRKEVERVLV